MKRGSSSSHETSPPAAAQSSPNPTRRAASPDQPCAVIAIHKSAGLALKTSDSSSPSRASACGRPEVIRSEEHTYELQSLLRLATPVFPLKKKKKLLYTT